MYKLNVDKNYESFEPKEINTKINPKKILYKVAPYILSMGIMIGLSGCTKSNKNNNVEQLTLEQIKEYQQGMDQVYVSDLPTTNDYINTLPSDLKLLFLEDELYITDLSLLPSKCPNLESLGIVRCYSISNYEFIKDFPNLKCFYIKDNGIGVNKDLINYLNEKGIEHNLTQEMVDMDKEITKIVKDNITDDMSTEEKLNTLTTYVIEHMEYDKNALKNDELSSMYNSNSLKYGLEGKGVCINYSALLNCLLNKANITTNIIKNDDHAWNLVKLEGKYYYVDSTNVDYIPLISKLLLKHADIGFFYKQDPYSTALSAMSNIDDDSVTIPKELLELINEAEDEKSFIEKYGSNLYIDIIIIITILGIGKTIKRKVFD